MSLPCAECKGRCCTFPAFSPKEFNVVKHVVGIPLYANVRPIEHAQSYDPANNGKAGYVLYLNNGNCPYLGIKGECTIYHMRPQVCRDYGVVPELPCEYLYPKEAEAKQLERIKRSK
jgi:Fe-S-cluster containining protein